MQSIAPLATKDFEKPSIVVISKVEIDTDGEGNFQELLDIKTYNISINEENRVARFCSYSFNITCLNTDDRYGILNPASSYYNWLKQGRRIKLWAGIRKKVPYRPAVEAKVPYRPAVEAEVPYFSAEDEYLYQLILGRIDDFKLGKKAGQDICTITGRCLMRMVLDFKLYSPNTYWGISHIYNTVSNKIRYDMEDDCKGIYKVELDSTNKDGTALEEIFERSDWSYDWHNNQLVFTPQRIPDFAGTNNLKVYYFQTQDVENIVADILIGSGILQAKISAATISFSDGNSDDSAGAKVPYRPAVEAKVPCTILDSSNNFVIAGFKSGQTITVDTDSGTNDGIYTINTVTPGVITLIDSDSLTTEDATTAGTVTITTDVNLVSKTEWLASSSVVATNKTINRVWFDAGTSALKAITLLSEVVQYRFYLDYAGNPIFKPKPSAGSPVNTISDYETKVENIGENVDETYTHIIVIGEERDRILGEDEIAPEVPVNLVLSTGMGEITQASLAWIKAEWTANTESDFGHYELRIRKTAYSDYTEDSTITISFIWYGLEPGVEYSVEIRAVDIYNNRSEWSSAEIQLTATDTTAPAQITGAVATPLLAGIQVEWTKSMGTNVAGYAVERQESENGVTWTGGWSERVRHDSTMWMDLHLSYATYYRYRIKAFTQTGVEGPSSSPTADSVKPNKAGPDDIVAGSITGDHIAVNTIMANNYQELRNTYVQQGQDSLDASYPFELDFEIVSEMTAINNIKLSFRIRKFRAYSKGAASGGGTTSTYVTTPSGGGQTSSYKTTPSGGGQSSTSVSHTHSGQSVWPGGTHGHGWGWQDSTVTWTLGHTHHYNKFILISTGGVHSHSLDISSSGSHSHYVYNHTHPSHAHTVYNHTHPSHAHYVYAHTHNLVFGVYEETQSPTINVYIDNGRGYGGSIGSYNTSQLDIDITAHISGSGFKKVKFTSNVRTRISAWVLCKIDLSA